MSRSGGGLVRRWSVRCPVYPGGGFDIALICAHMWSVIGCPYGVPGVAWHGPWHRVPGLCTAGSPLSSSPIGFAILVLVQRVLAFSPSLLPPSSPPVSCPSDAHRSSLDSGLHPPPRSQLTGPLSTRTRDSRPHRSQDPPAPYHGPRLGRSCSRCYRRRH